MSDAAPLNIRSHRGSYEVRFGAPFAGLGDGLATGEHLLVDARVAELHAAPLRRTLEGPRVIKIDAREESKSLEALPALIERLLAGGCRRGHRLIAVGGGIVQDIAAFLAATLFRGMAWSFHPTTLLAQADSCIGSKSSINVLGTKNLLGTFTPPDAIHIATAVLGTLEPHDLRSGIGEMLKVHLIAGEAEFERIVADQPRLAGDPALLVTAIRRSLAIKQGFVERDEFDQGERLVLNYGHSFGHAIESATRFAVPHGIAVTLGMDLANHVSVELGHLPELTYRRIRPTLIANAVGFTAVDVPFDAFLHALARDKKNTGEELSLVLTRGPGQVFRTRVAKDATFEEICRRWFATVRKESR